MRLILALVVLYATCGFSQQKVQKQPAPAWVEPVTYVNPATDTLEETGGYRYLLIDRQFNLITKESYRRTATKIMTESGLESVSAINVNFDPAFESIYFHTILVKRGDQVIDKLPKAQFETLRREQNLDRLIYDKSLDVILNLDDIQVGDVVEYSYTIRGYNPVFNGKFTRIVYFNYSEPVGKIYTRVVTTKDRPFKIKTFNGALKPGETSTGGKTVYTWNQENVPALAQDDRTPSWFEAYDNVEMSEFNSWGEISAWALPLYTTRQSLPEVEKKLAEIKQRYVNLEDQVNASIRFVQDEIRYLSFSDGIQGYKPHDPEQVIRQRFGDCKDKSLLLTCMLKKLGVSAHPALVNTSTGGMLTDQLPSPTIFDHCIAEFQFNDSTYWIDPTQSLQRGLLKKRTTPNYHHALVISPETTSLTPMKPEDAWHSRIQIKEDYTLDHVGGPARLSVETTYTGAEANSIRNYWKSNSAADMKKDYTNFYANDYPDIKADSNVVFIDDDKNNVIICREYYSIKKMWDYDSAKGQYTTEFYARLIADYLKTPSAKSRTMPLAVNYPTAVEQTITIHLPEAWTLTEQTKKITSPAFVYISSSKYSDRTITYSFAYQALSESVDAAQADDHIRKIKEASENLQYSLTYSTGPTTTPAASQTSIPYLLILIVMAPFLFLAFKKLYRYDPRAGNYTEMHDQIGGVLILPAIGVAIIPINLIYQISTANYFNPEHWRILTDATYSAYEPGRGSLILWEFMYNISLIAFSILILILFFKKRTSLPLLIRIFYGAMSAGILIDALWLHLLGYPTTFDNIGNGKIPAGTRTLLTSIIWIPYFLISDRVKGTFRQRLD